MTDAIVRLVGVAKTYASGHEALKPTDLDIRRGELFALLGPNGAGKTTLINIVCGVVNASAGTVTVAGHDNVADYRAARAAIGLVPQELSVDMFESVLATVRFSRRLFGKPANDAYLEELLRDLALWDKRNSKIMELSGGMKRRVLIAKALSHEPDVLFLDEPTAGVDVTLRREMWALVGKLRTRGVTIILTTHYIEEAEEMADRVGVIDQGALLLVDDKAALMKQLGKRQLDVMLAKPLGELPENVAALGATLCDDGKRVHYVFDGTAEDTGMPALLAALTDAGVVWADLETRKSSLEDIFVELTEKAA